MNNTHTSKEQRIKLNISFYRRKQGLSQEALAEIVNISRTHMSTIEAINMPLQISLELLFDIADALKVDISKFFEDR